MREVILGRMIQLGHDKYVKSDAIIAVEPLDGLGKYYETDGNSNKLRTRVLIAHAKGEIIASRTAQTILRDMTRTSALAEIVSAWPVDKAAQEVAKDIPGVTVVDNHVQSPRDIADDKIEKNMLINYLVENDTVQGAVEASPFGRTKFYKLLKKYGIDTKDYKHVTNDSGHFGIVRSEDDGLV